MPCEFAFYDLGARRITIMVDARTAPSAAIPRDLGFVHEGTLRRHSKGVRGEVRDMMVFAMTHIDYRRIEAE